MPPGTDIFTKSDRPLNYSENTSNFDSETGPRLPGKETGESLPAAPAIPAERSGTGRKPTGEGRVRHTANRRPMKKRTRLLYGLLLLCAPLAGCLKEDDGSQFYSDVYWFPLAKQTFSVDTREPEPVDTVVLVFRARNFVYDSDTVNFAVMPDSTTAVAGTDYEITTPVVRFGKDDYYDNLLRGEIGLRIYPTLSDTLTLALKLIYTHPANEERFRLHDRTVLTLRPIFPSE